MNNLLKLTFSILLLTFLSGKAISQCNYSVSGQVTNASGQPVSGQMVYLDVPDPAYPGGFSMAAFTNPNGVYQFNFIGPCSGVLPTFLFTPSCDTIFDTLMVAQNQPLTNNFVVCDTVSCSGTVNVSYIPQGVHVSASVPWAQGYNWTFSDGVGYYSSSVTHIFADTGSYEICLTSPVSSACIFDTCFTVHIVPSNLPDTCHVNGYITVEGNGIEFGWQGGNSLGAQPISVVWDFGNGSVTNNYPNGGTYTYLDSGAYTACVTVTWSGGCSATDCQTVIIGNPGNVPVDICGYVRYVNAANDTIPGACSTVYLFYADTGGVTLLDTAYVYANGYYCFGQYPAGHYTVLAIPCDSLLIAENLLPTYLGNVLFWQDADVFTGGSVENILLIGGQNVQGPGLIGGTIVWGDDKAPGDPVIGARVILLDAQSNPVRFTVTDNEGYYTFGNLPYGTYRIYPEATGFTTYPVMVNLTAETSPAEATNFSFGFGAFMGIEEQPVTFRGLFPNPAPGQATLSLVSKESGNGSIGIADLTGKVVARIPVSITKGQQNITLDLKTLTAGVYTVTLTMRGRQLHTKLIKQ